MARVLAFHAGRLHWHAPSAHFWHNLGLAALWLVIISMGIVLFGSIIFTVIATLGQTPYLQGGGGMGAAMPLNFLATFMAAWMLPLFMPLAIPVILLVSAVALPFDPVVRHHSARLWGQLTSSSG